MSHFNILFNYIVFYGSVVLLEHLYSTEIKNEL